MFRFLLTVNPFFHGIIKQINHIARIDLMMLAFFFYGHMPTIRIIDNNPYAVWNKLSYLWVDTIRNGIIIPVPMKIVPVIALKIRNGYFDFIAS